MIGEIVTIVWAEATHVGHGAQVGRVVAVREGMIVIDRGKKRSQLHRQLDDEGVTWVRGRATPEELRVCVVARLLKFGRGPRPTFYGSNQ